MQDDNLLPHQDISALDAETELLLDGARNLFKLRARDNMTPRTQMVVLSTEDTFKALFELIKTHNYSRVPIVSKDDNARIEGFIHLKDVLSYLIDTFGTTGLTPDLLDQPLDKKLLKEIVFIPESKRLHTLLREFRSKHIHMAIVLDEYDNVSGLITIEDILESIVGDIEDEYEKGDSLFSLVTQSKTNQVFLVKAHAPLEDFNDYFKTDIQGHEFDTIGGMLLKHFSRIPEKSESMSYQGLVFRILDRDDRRIKSIEVTRSMH